MKSIKVEDTAPNTQPLGSGLPPSGLAGQWLGFDKANNVYVLRWIDEAKLWHGVGFDPRHPDMPLAFATWGGDPDCIIVRHQAIR